MLECGVLGRAVLGRVLGRGKLLLTLGREHITKCFVSYTLSLPQTHIGVSVSTERCYSYIVHSLFSNLL